MKRMLLILTVLLGWSAAQADDYMPLLREGVKWVYAEEYEDWDGTTKRLYSMEVKGDTVIDGTTYKKVYRISLDSTWTSPKYYEAAKCSETQPVA